ncbi:hypothetical protein T492DRAFT_833796 [Pavlovales sp. CCMP2436]|nr:hypothetical protein T492DRAFT_833796 [Pavlovales sp. CCMP2436]
MKDNPPFVAGRALDCGLFVLSSNSSLGSSKDTSSALYVVRTLFGAKWRYGDYGRNDCLVVNPGAARRYFGSVSPDAPYPPIEEVKYYTEQHFLTGVPAEEYLVAEPAALPANERTAETCAVSVAMRHHGEGCVAHAMIVNGDNSIPGLAIFFVRHAAAPEADAPWSPTTHASFPARARARALLCIGRLLEGVMPAESSGTWRDAFAAVVMPLCVIVSGLTSETANRCNGRDARVVSYTEDGSRVGIEVLKRKETTMVQDSKSAPPKRGCRLAHLGLALDLRARVAVEGVEANLLVKPENLHAQGA